MKKNLEKFWAFFKFQTRNKFKQINSNKLKFSECFIVLVLFKNNSLKVKIKTQNTLIKWETERSEELVLIIFCYFTKRNQTIAWKNPHF